MVVGYLGSLGIPTPLSSLIVLVASSAIAGLLSFAMAPKVPGAVSEQGVAEVQPEEAVRETFEPQQPVQEEAKPPQPAVETAPTVAGKVQTQPEQVAAAQPAEVKPSPEVKVKVPEVGEEGEEELLMVCLNCKREVPAKAAYCPYCGTKL
jgi:outer membrane biosynthesis protein TonB